MEKKGPVGQERLLLLPNRLNMPSWVTCRIFEQLRAHGFQAAQCEYVSQLALKHVLLYKEDSVQIKRQINTFSSASGAFEKNARLNSGLKKKQPSKLLLCVLWETNLCRSSAASSSMEAFLFSGSPSSCLPCRILTNSVYYKEFLNKKNFQLMSCPEKLNFTF